MDDKLKTLIRRALLVAAWRGGDVSTEDGSFAVTDVDAMIHLQDAIQEAFGIEADEYRKILPMIEAL